VSNRFTMTFTAEPQHIDVMGHVNNAVWVQWMEAIATAHWEADAAPEHIAAYVWVVTRHEIDYRGNIKLGESVTAETFIPQGPSGPRFDRHFEFRPILEDGAAGKPIVSARTTWVMIDRQTGRILRVPPEVSAPFLS
jgi:acyl-CoA thioester hydrolase